MFLLYIQFSSRRLNETGKRDTRTIGMRLPDDEVEFGDVWAAGIKGHSRNCSGLETELENAHVDIPMSDYGVILKSGCIFMKRLKKEMNVFKWQRKLVFAECWKIFNMR